jgi:hypothetical protein
MPRILKRSKGITEVPDEELVGVLEFHSDDVKPTGSFNQFRIFGQVSESDFPDLTTLAWRNGFLGKPAFGFGPGFDFKENQGRAVPGDDVDFSPAEAIPAGDDLKSFSKKIADGGRFAAAA